MIVPCPTGMQAAAFNIGRLALYSCCRLAWRGLPGLGVLFIHALRYGIQIQTQSGAVGRG